MSDGTFAGQWVDLETMRNLRILIAEENEVTLPGRRKFEGPVAAVNLPEGYGPTVGRLN